MPGNGQARMIAMLGTLAEIQSRRRAQDLAEAQFEESKHQFATSMGFNEKGQEYKKVSDILDAIARSSSESRAALIELGKSVGLPDQQVAALSHYGMTAPETIETIRNKSAGAGVASMDPAARNRMNQEAASVATTGMNQGASAMSALTSALAGGGDPTAAYGKDMLRNMLPGFIQHVATGQTTDQAAISNAIAANPAMVNRAADIQTGAVSPYQQQSLTIQGQQAQAALGQVSADFYRTNAQIIANSQELSMKLLSAKALGGLTPENLITATGQMKEILQAFGKEKSESNRNYLLGLYNNLAKIVNPSLMTTPDAVPQAAGYLDRFQGMFSNPGFPQQTPSPQIPAAPFGQTSPFMNSPFTPINPFPNSQPPGVRP